MKKPNPHQSKIDFVDSVSHFKVSEMASSLGFTKPTVLKFLRSQVRHPDGDETRVVPRFVIRKDFAYNPREDWRYDASQRSRQERNSQDPHQEAFENNPLQS